MTAIQPALVGIARLTQRVTSPDDGVDAVALMAEAAAHAVGDAAIDPSTIDLIVIPRGTWRTANPGPLIAERIGARNAKTVIGEIGVLQHTLIKRVCDDIASSAIRAAVVVGGEAKYRQVVTAKAGGEAADPVCDIPPTEILRPHDELVTRFDFERGIVQAPVQYALIESAFTHAHGTEPAIGALWADFAALARHDELAWDRTAPMADTITTVSDDNRMVAAPYTKLLCSQWNVDQAAALVFSDSPNDDAVFPIAATESNAMIPLLQREQVHEWAGFKLAAKRALDLTHLAIDDMDLLEIYSCFPVAVKVQAREIGIHASRDLTVTGGMTFGGGPLNNFVLQATARMAERLRDGDGATGMVTGISGLLTKPGVTIWSTTPGVYASDDLARETLKATPTVPFNPDGTGPATIVGHTVSYDRYGIARALAIVQFDDWSRSAAGSSEPEDIEAFQTTDCVGRRVEVSPADTLRLR